MKRKMKWLCLTICILCSFILHSITISAATVPIVPQRQIDTNLCWAASCSVINNYLCNTKRSQTRVVILSLGIYQNTTLNMNGVRDNFLGNPSIASCYSLSRKPTYDVVYSQIDSSKPVFASSKLLQTGNKYSGHAIVIYGATTSGTTKYLMYMDPSDGSNHTATYEAMTQDLPSSNGFPVIDGVLYNIAFL